MNKTKKNIDLELITRIKKNDSVALDILFNRYFFLLCDFSFRFVKSVDLAEEAVADVFLNIWLKRGRIEIKTSVKSYLYTAVRNQSINYLKKEKNFYEELELVDKEGIYSTLSADNFIQYEELKKELDKILDKMPNKMRLVFKMSRIDGLSYKEIAEILSISINTVQNHMVKAFKFLSEQYPLLLAAAVLTLTKFSS